MWVSGAGHGPGRRVRQSLALLCHAVRRESGYEGHTQPVEEQPSVNHAEVAGALVFLSGRL